MQTGNSFTAVQREALDFKTHCTTFPIYKTLENECGLPRKWRKIKNKNIFLLLPRALDGERIRIQTFLSFSHYFLSTQTIVYKLEAHWTSWKWRLEEYLQSLDSEIDEKRRLEKEWSMLTYKYKRFYIT